LTALVLTFLQPVHFTWWWWW